MKMPRYFMAIAALLIWFLLPAAAQPAAELLRALQRIPGLEIRPADSNGVFDAYYLLSLEQPLDHNNPAAGSFRQRLFLGHRGAQRPVVMETEGYMADYALDPNHQNEPASLLEANQLVVEHRFFGKSVPARPDWQYLSIRQAAADYHRIKTLFSEVYPGKWIATGSSKGGQTATAYNVFYPGEMAATIAYVAPLNYALQDKRIDKHFKRVGTADCRKQILSWQRRLLENKDELVPVYERLVSRAGFSFGRMPAARAFEYSVLEYPFSFWQYGSDCSNIPAASDAKSQWVLHLAQTVFPGFYTEPMLSDFAPSFYMFYRELGYYEYNEKPFKKWLSQADYPNSFFLPEGVSASFDPSYIQQLKSFVDAGINRMVFINGAADPWGATAVQLNGKGDAISLTQSRGSHNANIRSLPPDQRAQVLQTLYRWLDITAEP